MEIIKEWYDKHGLAARFMSLNFRGSLVYCLDFCGCKRSAEFEFKDGKLEGSFEFIPKRYIKFIKGYFGIDTREVA